MARCVRDVGLLLDAMEGNGGWDFAPPPLPADETWEAVAIRGVATNGSGMGHVRVRFSDLGCTVAPQVRGLCRMAAAVLAGKDTHASEVQELEAGTLDFEMAKRIFLVLRGEKFSADFEEEMANPALVELLKPEIRWNASIGKVPEAEKMATTARSELVSFSAQVAAMFENVDILCTPATLDAAFDAAVRYPTEQVGQTFTNYLEWMMPACIVTMMLCPALVMPCGFLQDGRPVGLQLVGRPGADAIVLEAAALESLLKLPKCCPSPRQGSAPLDTVGPKTVEQAAAHHEGEVGRFVQRYFRNHSQL